MTLKFFTTCGFSPEKQDQQIRYSFSTGVKRRKTSGPLTGIGRYCECTATENAFEETSSSNYFGKLSKAV